MVEVAIWGPAIGTGRAWHVMFTGVHGLEPEASFDEGDELLVGESTPEFRIRHEKRSTTLLAREQPDFGLRSGDAAEDTVVGEFVCSDSELELDSFEYSHRDECVLGANSKTHLPVV